MKGPVSDSVDALAAKVRALNTASGAGTQDPTSANAKQKVPGTSITYGAYKAFYDARPADEQNETFAQWAHKRGIPGYATGGLVPGLPGTPQLAIVHGGERVLTPQQQRQGGVTVTQENHFHGSDAPAQADLDYANRQLGWKLARSGRS